MNITIAKVQQYLKDQGVDPGLAQSVVSIGRRNPEDPLFIRSWNQDIVARPDDSYWDIATEYDPVPDKVSPRQFRLALIQSGTSLADVTTAIATLPDDGTRDAATVEWEYANFIARDNPLIASLAPSLGYDTEEKVDNLFRLAGGL